LALGCRWLALRPASIARLAERTKTSIQRLVDGRWLALGRRWLALHPACIATAVPVRVVLPWKRTRLTLSRIRLSLCCGWLAERSKTAILVGSSWLSHDCSDCATIRACIAATDVPLRRMLTLSRIRLSLCSRWLAERTKTTIQRLVGSRWLALGCRWLPLHPASIARLAERTKASIQRLAGCRWFALCCVWLALHPASIATITVLPRERLTLSRIRLSFGSVRLAERSKATILVNNRLLTLGCNRRLILRRSKAHSCEHDGSKE